MTGKHRGGEHNPLERVVDGTSSPNQGEDFVSQTVVGMNLETPHVTARHFALPIDRQRQEVTTPSTERGGDYPTQADFGGNPKKAKTARVAAREEAAIGRHQRGTTSTKQNEQFDPRGRRVNCSFLPSGYAAYCMLYLRFFCFAFLQFPMLSY